MPKEYKAIELKDEELEKANGGTAYFDFEKYPYPELTDVEIGITCPNCGYNPKRDTFLMGQAIKYSRKYLFYFCHNCGHKWGKPGVKSYI